MASIEMVKEYVIRLSHDEMRLVSLGLAGKLKGRDTLEAQALSVKLLERRYKDMESLVEVLRGQFASAAKELAVKQSFLKVEPDAAPSTEKAESVSRDGG